VGRAEEADAEDAVADVFRQLLDRDAALLRGLRPPYHLRAWLAVVVRRTCLRLMRRKPPSPPAPSEPRAPDPELAAALEKLPPDDRLLLELFFTHDAPYGEIASVLGISVESVGKQKFRALQRLKELLGRPDLDA
jgi:RNA polymerase sigma-70 factor (ECF subfamily)